MAVNVTANWRLICAMDPLLKFSDAGRVVFLTSGRAARARAYWGPYAVSKAALETLARTYAAETVTTNVRVNLLTPGPVRTRMRAQAMPGEDPMTSGGAGRRRREDRRIVPAEHARERQDLRLSEAPVARVSTAGVTRPPASARGVSPQAGSWAGFNAILNSTSSASSAANRPA